MPTPSEITQLLVDLSKGDKTAKDKLIDLVYDELRRQASAFLRRERRGHTLQTTDLVHETYFKLINQKEVQWQNRAHFFAIAAEAMRRFLVDYARKRSAAKRGGGQAKVALDDATLMAAERPEELVALDEALTTLGELDQRQHQIVEQRFFAGCKLEEIAENLGISVATVKRDWNSAKAWLHREMVRRLAV
jgi:RNA polymerase sigma factor (TIGR02999 family)